MTDNSQNSELLVESQEANPKIQEKEEAAPGEDGMDAEDKAKEEVVQDKPAPKSRGRPAGSKDNKPRIKRVPVQQVQQPPPQQQETAAKEATPKKPRKKVEIRYEEEPEKKPKQVRFQYEEEEPVEEEPPPPPKSHHTLHKERVQAAAMQRRQIAQARQDHFERILDNFMGF